MSKTQLYLWVCVILALIVSSIAVLFTPIPHAPAISIALGGAAGIIATMGPVLITFNQSIKSSQESSQNPGERQPATSHKPKLPQAVARRPRKAVVASVVGAIAGLSALGYSTHEVVKIEQLRLLQITNLSAIAKSKNSRLLIPLPSDGQLVLASVVGPDTKQPVSEWQNQYKPTQCYFPPPEFSFVLINKDSYPGHDTNGRDPQCGAPTHNYCERSGVRCWNIRLLSGCLVSTTWLTAYQTWLKNHGLPAADPNKVCDANAEFPLIQAVSPRASTYPAEKHLLAGALHPTR